MNLIPGFLIDETAATAIADGVILAGVSLAAVGGSGSKFKSRVSAADSSLM